MQVEVTELAGTPIGPVSVAVSGDGLIATAFGTAARLRKRLAAAGYRDAGPGPAAEGIAAQVLDYLHGRRTTWDCVLDWSLSAGFTRACLQRLHADVPFGEVITYGGLAAALGAPGAARAVGEAMHNNPVPIVVPCHRVVGHDGLGGFGGGRRTKEYLLGLEGSLTLTLPLA